MVVTMAPRKAGVTAAEKTRLLLLAGFAVVLAVIIFSDLLESGAGEGPAGPVGPRIEVSQSELDPRILEEIQDDLPRQRVRREEKPFQHLLAQAAKLVPGTLEAMGLPDAPLDYEAVLADPGSFRGKPVWVRGRLVEEPQVLPYAPVRGLHDVRAKILDDRDRLYMCSVAMPPRRPLKGGDWVKAKGFFYKLWDPDLKESKVPYLVGPRLFPSWPEWAPVRELDPSLFVEILDGSTLDPEETEPEAFYHFLSYTVNLPKERVDRAPRLDELTMARLRHDPAGTRGLPTRLFLLVHDIPEIRMADENPLGLRRITRLWAISDVPRGVLRLILPEERFDLAKGQELEVVGVFLRNQEYAPKDQSVGRAAAPVFLAAAATVRQVDRAQFSPLFKWTLLASAAAVTALLAVLVLRDRRAHLRTLEGIARRRRQRTGRGEASAGA